MVTNRTYDSITSWPSAITSGPNGSAALQNESYSFDYLGNVTQRQNNNAGLTENFYYDSDYRLDHSSLNGTLNLQMQYDGAGNITSRSDLAGGATWTYDATHKHAVTQAGSSANSYTYDANGNAISRNGLGITWTSYNHPSLINNSGGGDSVQFAYTHTHERWSAVLNSSAGVETTYFIGDLLEKVSTAGTVEYRHSIFAGGTKVAIVSRTSGGANTVHYVREDHQGSVATILNSDGTTYVKESFTAFGARRSACTWSGPPTNGQVTKMNAVTRHGYTWQTALGSMGLNDMNGRIQDAVTGRFLSADPTISDPTLPQDFNRYSFVRNNPLTFTDPTGFAVASGKNRNGSVIAGPVVSRLVDLRPDLASSLFGGGVSEAIGAPSFGGSVEGIQGNDAGFSNGSGSGGYDTAASAQASADQVINAINESLEGSVAAISPDSNSPDESSAPSDSPGEVVVTGTRSGGTDAVSFAGTRFSAPLSGGTLTPVVQYPLIPKITKAIDAATEVAGKALKMRILGAEGEAEARRVLTLAGYEILASQLYVETSVGLRITDFVVEGGPENLPMTGVEIKVNSATRSPLQMVKDYAIAVQGGTVVNWYQPVFPYGSRVQYYTIVSQATVTFGPP